MIDEFELCEKTRLEILNNKTTSPLKAIHNFCIECMGYHKTWVKEGFLLRFLSLIYGEYKYMGKI